MLEEDNYQKIKLNPGERLESYAGLVVKNKDGSTTQKFTSKIVNMKTGVMPPKCRFLLKVGNASKVLVRK